MFYLPLSLFNFIARLNFFMPFSTILLFSLPNVFYFSPPQFLLFSPLLYCYSLSLSLESADMKTRCRCYRSVVWATRERSLRTRSCSRSLSRARSGQSIVSVLEVVYTLYTASISTISMPYYQRGQKVWPYFSFMKELNWLTVEKLIYLRSATLAFKCMTGSAPDYLTYKMTDVSTTCAVVIFRVLLSQLNSRLLLVKLSQAKLTTREWQFD